MFHFNCNVDDYESYSWEMCTLFFKWILLNVLILVWKYRETWKTVATRGQICEVIRFAS